MTNLSTLRDDILLHLPEMLDTLNLWCEINTHALNINGLTKNRNLIKNHFSQLTNHIETLNYSSIQQLRSQQLQLGPSLWIQQRPKLTRRIILVGHMDTVFPQNTSFTKVTKIHPNKLQGPGVADMKSGLLILWYALYFFEKFNISKKLGWDVFINSDEEIGSIASGPDLMQRSQKHQIGLVFEPALDDVGTLARARKGIGHYMLKAQGKAAHSGRDFKNGVNAIILLNQGLLDLHNLNNNYTEVSWNIANIHGGQQANQIPEAAEALIEVRFSQPESEKWIQEQLDICCQKHPGLSYIGHVHRPAKVISSGTQKLFAIYQSIAKSLNISLEWQDTGGACDGNLLAKNGMPVLDTLGACGGGLHTEQEYILIDSLVERIELTTRLLITLAESDLEQIIC